MGDSEDEFSSLSNRNKFESERADLFNKDVDGNGKHEREESTEGKRRSIQFPNNWGRRNSPIRRNRYWENRSGSGENRQHYSRNSSNFRHGYQQFQRRPRDIDYNRIMSFKDFIALQDDKITPENACQKYEEYKTEFSHRQLPLFFEKQKKYEWFLIKYHPYYSTIDKIRTIRFSRMRVSVFNFLVLHDVLKSITLDSKCTFIARFLEIVNYLLDNAPRSDVFKMIKLLQGSQSDALINGDLSDCVMNLETDTLLPIKRKFEADLEWNEADTDLDDEQSKSYQHICIEIKNVPLVFTHKKLLKAYKSIDGFSRIALFPPETNESNHTKAYVTFRSGTDYKTALQAIKDAQIDDFIPETSRIQHFSPIIRSFRGAWGSEKVVIAQISKLIEIIRKLDEDYLIYSDRFPPIPDYNSSLETEENTSSTDNSTPIETKSGSESEGFASGDEMEERTENCNENTCLLEAEKIVSQFSFDDKIIKQADNSLVSVLDSLIIYLRVVHSCDFYSFSKNVLDNDMPLRCQNLSVRRSLPIASLDENKIDAQIALINSKAMLLGPIKSNFTLGTIDEISRNFKEEKTQIDNFFEEKAKELRPNVWICHLCKKKFQGKEFVHKHIFNKHSQNIDLIKINVQFYNNFIGQSRDLSIITDECILPLSGELGFYHLIIHIENEDATIPVAKKSNISTISDVYALEPLLKKSLTVYSNLEQSEFNSFDF
ncbi:hypothetical protein MXB_1365 [Myxobolus squamalis]|nr:hypothetical protein MXB_1365 [Myxobolus squamalis]